MTNQFRYSIASSNEEVRKENIYTLEEITAKEIKDKELLGRSGGKDLAHCTYLGLKHCKNFIERAKWYHRTEEVDDQLKELRQIHPEAISIEFYAEVGGKN